MSEQNESLVRGAYEAYSRGDIAKLLDIIDPDLKWTYLDPSLADPEPQTCHGREQLQWALEGQAERRLRSEVEELAASGDKGHGHRPYAGYRPAASVAGRRSQLPCADATNSCADATKGTRHRDAGVPGSGGGTGLRGSQLKARRIPPNESLLRAGADWRYLHSATRFLAQRRADRRLGAVSNSVLPW